VWPGIGTVVWAEGAGKQATAEIEIPETARLLRITAQSFPPDNGVTVTINDGAPTTFRLGASMRQVLLRLLPVPEASVRPNSPPFALFLDSTEALPYVDGYVSYTPMLRSNSILVSDPKPAIVTVGCGYDDSRIRYPASVIDREDGARYRRSWEAALDGRPDVVFVNTWSEWGEGSVVEPTVEFGYQYLELTLTYSLIFKGKMQASPKPGAMGLTVTRYDASEIRFTTAGDGEVTFQGLPEAWVESCTVTRNGEPFDGFDADASEGLLRVRVPGAGAYVIRGGG
jgi:hypothetical protein